ncbi:hypothetical protein CPB83DRAFT_835806 [Crepidotus variabilis]|uniref:Uncharacterized protein n=1 Tax=Crepidotus variabilis TaxID=179855 RepID=A0A9P6EGL1_9AGAR|nr:hypothetical protein CPB83DRAFT_835806 [Crepidotus variabilis]
MNESTEGAFKRTNVPENLGKKNINYSCRYIHSSVSSYSTLSFCKPEDLWQSSTTFVAEALPAGETKGRQIIRINVVEYFVEYFWGHIRYVHCGRSWQESRTNESTRIQPHLRSISLREVRDAEADETSPSKLQSVETIGGPVQPSSLSSMVSSSEGCAGFERREWLASLRIRRPSFKAHKLGQKSFPHSLFLMTALSTLASNSIMTEPLPLQPVARSKISFFGSFPESVVSRPEDKSFVAKMDRRHRVKLLLNNSENLLLLLVVGWSRGSQKRTIRAQKVLFNVMNNSQKRYDQLVSAEDAADKIRLNRDSVRPFDEQEQERTFPSRLKTSDVNPPSKQESGDIETTTNVLLKRRYDLLEQSEET